MSEPDSETPHNQVEKQEWKIIRPSTLATIDQTIYCLVVTFSDLTLNKWLQAYDHKLVSYKLNQLGNQL
jgi:hypothetical protein